MPDKAKHRAVVRVCTRCATYRDRRCAWGGGGGFTCPNACRAAAAYHSSVSLHDPTGARTGGSAPPPAGARSPPPLLRPCAPRLCRSTAASSAAVGWYDDCTGATELLAAGPACLPYSAPSELYARRAATASSCGDGPGPYALPVLPRDLTDEAERTDDADLADDVRGSAPTRASSSAAAHDTRSLSRRLLRGVVESRVVRLATLLGEARGDCLGDTRGRRCLGLCACGDAAAPTRGLRLLLTSPAGAGSVGGGGGTLPALSRAPAKSSALHVGISNGVLAAGGLWAGDAA